MQTTHKICKIWTDSDYIYASTEDGLTAKHPFAKFDSLNRATSRQRESFTLSRHGIHWE